jgi:hypothetical protein
MNAGLNIEGPDIFVVPEKENKVFALYIGYNEVMMRSGLDLKELNTLQKVYDKMNSTRGKLSALSLIF